MMGLILKDVLNLRNYIKQFGLMLIFFTVYSIVYKNTSFFAGMLPMMGSMIVLTSMNYDEYQKWDRYALTMPITPKDIVRSKYLLLFISDTIAFLASGMTRTLSSSSVWMASAACMGIFYTIFSIIIPVGYKYGIEKSRYIMIVIFMIPTLGFVAIANLVEKSGMQLPDNVEQYIVPTAVLAVVLIVVIVTIAYKTSVKIMENKEY